MATVFPLLNTMSNINNGASNSGGVGGAMTPKVGGTLDANVYATKKTIAQGLLDVALLTANASQLKYLLQAGSEHEFYYVMMVLIILSIILQVAFGCVAILKGRRDINDEAQQPQADFLNNLAVWLVFISVVVQVLTGCLMLLVANTNLNDPKKQARANRMNNTVTIGVFLVAILNILISALGIKNSDDVQNFIISQLH